MASHLEVETKFKVENISETKKIIEKIADFIKRETKRDDYYALKKKGYPRKAFRIRYNGESYVVNFKNWVKRLYSDDIVVKREYEFELKTRNQLENFLELMKDLGFRKWIGKTKFNSPYSYKRDKHLIIELNKVKNLGYFVELEYLCNEKQVKKAKKMIRKALKDLNVKKSQINNTGYTKMLYEKKH